MLTLKIIVGLWWSEAEDWWNFIKMLRTTAELHPEINPMDIGKLRDQSFEDFNPIANALLGIQRGSRMEVEIPEDCFQCNPTTDIN